MKIIDELKGKEVIDNQGNKVGDVSDVEWNQETNKVEQLLVSEGASAKIGISDKTKISIDDVDSIGEKVLLKVPKYM